MKPLVTTRSLSWLEHHKRLGTQEVFLRGRYRTSVLLRVLVFDVSLFWKFVCTVVKQSTFNLSNHKNRFPVTDGVYTGMTYPRKAERKCIGSQRFNALGKNCQSGEKEAGVQPWGLPSPKLPSNNREGGHKVRWPRISRDTPDVPMGFPLIFLDFPPVVL